MSSSPPPAPETDSLLEFIIQLGQAYLASGEQTAEVESILRRVAVAYGARRARVVAFPTAIFLSLHDKFEEHVTLAEGLTISLRLDQIGDIYHLGDTAQRGEITPQAGLARISEILRTPARFGLAGAIGGHAILSLGLAMVIRPTLANLIMASMLGALVGALKLLNRNRPLLSVQMPVFAAMLVSAIVFLASKWFPVDPLYALIPPLVTFLPGGRLSLGMVELAYGDMVSGASRLITGFVQLLLLATGLAAGATLVGYSPENLVDYTSEAITPSQTFGANWLGVMLFAFGVFIHYSAPRKSLLWMQVVVLTAFVTQQISAQFVGTTASGFFGMLAVTPLSYFIQARFKGPPAMVTFLPGFWVLVPGVLSLVGVKYMFSDREAGIDGMITALFAIVSIALGTLIGASIYKGLVDSAKWRQNQLRRLSRLLGRKP